MPKPPPPISRADSRWEIPVVIVCLLAAPATFIIALMVL